MKHKDIFSSYHPAVNMLYFTLVMIFSMFLMHPICLGVSFICAFIYSVTLNGKQAIRFVLQFMIPVLIITSLINPAFSHDGVTVLTYLPGGNPLTLESVFYGIASAFMLITVIAWFSCFNTVMTSDKLVYIFGRLTPALCLVLSMSLRFIPRFKSQIKLIANAQRYIGRDMSRGGVLKRARQGVRVLSITVTWALENGIETADSMKSRGYGLSKRTAFSVFHFDKRDGAALLFLLLCASYILSGWTLGGLKFLYFPMITGSWTFYSLSLFAVYFALCSAPVFINIKEERKWNALESKI